MITDDLRTRLVTLILRVPEVLTENGRTVMLAGIPDIEVLVRERGVVAVDIEVIILQLVGSFTADNSWRLLRLIDNARDSVRGTELAAELMSIRHELCRCRTANVARAGQVHAFDLQLLVLKCVVQLLDQPAGLLGFAIPGATHGLLKHFCESLKHGAAEHRKWKREEVAAIPAPLRVGPLHISVAAAVELAQRNRRLLTAKHVLWPAYVDSAQDAAALWQQICSSYQDARLVKHFTVIFGTPCEGVPDGMLALPTPQFTPDHIQTWVMDIAKVNVWNEMLVKRCVSMIVMGYAQTRVLPLDVVYDRLEHCHGLVNQHRDDHDGLLQALMDLEGGW